MSWRGVRYAVARTMPFALAAGAWSHHAAADASVTPFADAQVEHNSNVFGADVNSAFNVGSTASMVSKVTAGAEGQVNWGPGDFDVDLKGQRFLYDAFSQLNHYEYDTKAALNWRFGSVVDAQVSYSQSSALEQFADILTIDPELNRTRVSAARVRVLVMPQWRVDLTPRLTEDDMPLPQFPRFRLRETEGSASLNYLGISNLTAGLLFDYAHGAYSGIDAATRYNSRSAELTAEYKVGGRTSLSGDLGYTSRSDAVNPAGFVTPGAVVNAAGLNGTTSSFTGKISLTQQLTSKTSLSLTLFRDVASYAAGANAEVGQGGSFDLKWSPDFRFTIMLSGRYEHDAVQGSVLLAGTDTRTDTLKSGGLDVGYHLTNAFSVHVFANYNSRNSTLDFAQYSATEYGLKLEFRPQKPFR